MIIIMVIITCTLQLLGLLNMGFFAAGLLGVGLGFGLNVILKISLYIFLASRKNNY